MTNNPTEILLDQIEESVAELEKLEDYLRENEMNPPRATVSQIREDLARTAITVAYSEKVKNASDGDTILLDEANRSVENLSDE